MGVFTGNYKKETYQDNEIEERMAALYKGLGISRTIESQHFEELKKNDSDIMHYFSEEMIKTNSKQNKIIEYLMLPWYKKMFISFKKFNKK
jgi:hypothetical protein